MPVCRGQTISYMFHQFCYNSSQHNPASAGSAICNVAVEFAAEPVVHQPAVVMHIWKIPGFETVFLISQGPFQHKQFQWHDQYHIYFPCGINQTLHICNVNVKYPFTCLSPSAWNPTAYKVFTTPQNIIYWSLYTSVYIHAPCSTCSHCQCIVKHANNE